MHTKLAAAVLIALVAVIGFTLTHNAYEPGDGSASPAPVARLDSSEAAFLRLVEVGPETRPSEDLVKIGHGVCSGFEMDLNPWTVARTTPSALAEVPVYDSFSENRIGEQIMNAAVTTLCPQYAARLQKDFQ